MNINEYQEKARRTKNPAVSGWASAMEAALGIGSEAGEIIGIIDAWQFRGHELNKAALVNEMGDLLWYLCEMCDYAGVQLADVAENNIRKLERRYPQGFTADLRRGRVD